MFPNIKEYLKKFVGMTPPDDFIKEEIIKIIKKEIGADIHKKNISVSGGIIYIKTTPIIKNEIFMRKDKILSYINNINKKTTVVAMNIL